ncbi:helix-turn-helix transcriptional regulator [Leptolyngbya cf. ectocarpi LEGE 11479]|uniref:Helix-turn-helix transcriptional regulator n=1 Tax=Leptolyngbya cf. ectocarpi LEGE 11479 TaxID=1828722 RepID=A0A929A073_LEPEC|nr:helix-turn-helix transcriptional regulator [Leptolyngbya ectocarpi]MBE9070633.1 helix-turn-helix transcriptional regulator [Leptolyngbya cf. ectocarpi LEGE 11479]
MGRASTALKQVLDTYGISQNKLAVTMGISRANVGRWYHGLDPSAENIALIAEALKVLNIEAAQKFVRLYLGVIVDD